MTHSPDILHYYGSTPQRESFAARVLRLLGNAIVLVLFATILTARFALLAAGYTCIFVGTLMLTLGGRRSAAERLARWRSRAAELLKLWLADIARPLRRRSPLPVLPT
jgi:hypothetical protein